MASWDDVAPAIERMRSADAAFSDAVLAAEVADRLWDRAMEQWERAIARVEASCANMPFGKPKKQVKRYIEMCQELSIHCKMTGERWHIHLEISVQADRARAGAFDAAGYAVHAYYCTMSELPCPVNDVSNQEYERLGLANYGIGAAYSLAQRMTERQNAVEAYQARRDRDLLPPNARDERSRLRAWD